MCVLLAVILNCFRLVQLFTDGQINHHHSLVNSLIKQRILVGFVVLCLKIAAAERVMVLANFVTTNVSCYMKYRADDTFFLMQRLKIVIN